MIKGKIKRTAALLLAATMLLSVTGCGSKKEESSKVQEQADTKEMVYSEEELTFEGAQGTISSVFMKDDKFYFDTFEWLEDASEAVEEGTKEDSDSEGESEEDINSEEDANAETGEEAEEEIDEDEYVNGKDIFRFYSANKDGSDVKEIPIELNEDEYFRIIDIDAENNICGLINEYDEKSENTMTYLVKFTQEGKEVSRDNLTDLLDLGQEDYICQVLFDDQGRMIAVQEQTVTVTDASYKKLFELKVDSYIDGAAMTKDGQIICANSNQDGAVIKVVDMEKQKWGEDIKMDFSYFNGSDSLLNGMEYDFYYTDNSGIYGYDMAAQKGIKLMDYMASDISTEYTYGIRPIGDGKFVGTKYDGNQTGVKVSIYSKVDPSTIKDKVTVTVGTLYPDEQLKSVAVDFNKKSDKYRIEIKDYSQEEDPTSKMNADILAGNVPDIICTSYLPVEQYVAKGMLEDLTPYYEKDTELNIEDIIDSVAEAMKINDKMYYVTPEFYISTLVASKKDVGDKTGWTFDEFKALLEEKGDDVRPFEMNMKSSILYNFIGYNISDFVDWESGKCSFDSQDFKNILELSNQGDPDSEDYWDEDAPTLPKLIQDGKVLFKEGAVTIEEIQVAQKMFGGDITFIGYPNEKKEGNYANFSTSYAIYSKSENKDAAWEFIRTFMTKEYQAKNILMYGGTPTRKDVLEMQIKAATTTEEYTDEFGNEISPVDSSYGYDDWETEIGPASEKEIELFRELINNVTKTADYNEEIISIIEEETKAYFEGDKSVDEVADIIQNRVTTYVNENR